VKRRHAVLISLGVAAVVVTGVLAATKSVRTSATTAKPTPAAHTVIVKQRRALDRWEASLRKALANRPPKLPKVPRFPHVVFPSIPSSTWTPPASAQPVAARAAAPAALRGTAAHDSASDEGPAPSTVARGPSRDGGRPVPVTASAPQTTTTTTPATTTTTTATATTTTTTPTTTTTTTPTTTTEPEDDVNDDVGEDGHDGGGGDDGEGGGGGGDD
jgi:hypothetical protein